MVPQTLLVNVFIFELPLQFGHKSVAMFHQLLVALPAVHRQVEVTCGHLGMGCVPSGQHIKVHGLWLVYPSVVIDDHVVNRSFQFVGFFEVGGELQMTFHRYRNGVIQQMKTMEIHVLQIGHHVGIDVFRTSQSIERDVTFDERVVAVYQSLGMSILHMGIGRHVIQVVVSVVELGDFGLSRKRSAG